MSRLQELIAELCPDGVEYKRVNQVVTIRNGSDHKHLGDGDIPVYGSGGVMRYVDTASYEGPSVLLPRKGSVDKVYFVDEPFWNVDTIFHTVIDESQVHPKFFYYLMVNAHLEQYSTSAARPSLTQRVLNKIVIPVPPIEVQREVVHILDEYTAAHDELVRQLEEEMALRGQQLSIARNEMFMPNDVENVAWVPLSELAEIGTGIHDTKDAIEGGKYVFYARGVDPLSLDEFDFDEVAIITAGDGAGVGKVFHYVDGKYALHQRAYRIHPVAESILPRYLLHYFKATFYPYIMRSAVSSSVTSIRRRMLDNYMVPVPPLEQQRLLVGRLDEMEALSNAMSSELQGQMCLEREQLALVRNQLLSFPEKVA